MSKPQLACRVFTILNSLIYSAFILQICIQIYIPVVNSTSKTINGSESNGTVDSSGTKSVEDLFATDWSGNSSEPSALETSMAMDSMCMSMDLRSASYESLIQCKKHWKTLLKKLNSVLDKKANERNKRLTSSLQSLADIETAFVLDRLNSIQVTEEEELINSSVAEETEKVPANSLRRYKRPLDLKKNNSTDECKRLSQQELVTELKQKGTYNPDLMAWDVSGVIRFLDRSIVDQYEHQTKQQSNTDETAERNIEALERILAELHLQCDVRKPAVLSRLRNLTASLPLNPISSLASEEYNEQKMRSKRQAARNFVHSFERFKRENGDGAIGDVANPKHQKIIGDVHVVPFGCDKRASVEDGYLRLCGACQAIRRLPDKFFPPFINEVMCDDDKACLYFYNFPHGKCKQKHMNFVVLRNMGTYDCQKWQKFNLNVRVSCECFVGK